MTMNRLPLIKCVAAVSLALAMAASASAAGYINNKTGWMALSPEAKAAYAQGLNDSLNYVFIDDSLTDALAKKGRTECLVAMQTNSSLLADRITQAYSDNRLADYAPTAIYIIKMGEICRSHINKERAAFGLGPM